MKLTFGALGPGMPFYMVGPRLTNASVTPLVLVSVVAVPEGGGATNVGWHLYKVPRSGAPRAFFPQRDALSATFFAQVKDVTKSDEALAPHASLPFDVLLYLEFRIKAHSAHKVDRLKIAYLQGGRKYEQTFNFSYRFQTPDHAPLP